MHVEPPTRQDEVEAAWREHLDPWCCPDCDVNHPANHEARVQEELSIFRATRDT